MRSKLQQAGLVFTGLCAGVLISLNFSANADKAAALAPLPVEELRNLVSQVQSTADQVSRSSAQAQTTSGNLLKSSEQQ